MILYDTTDTDTVGIGRIKVLKTVSRFLSSSFGGLFPAFWLPHPPPQFFFIFYDLAVAKGLSLWLRLTICLNTVVFCLLHVVNAPCSYDVMCVCCGVHSCVGVQVCVCPLWRTNNKQWLWPSIPVPPLSLHCLVLPRSLRVLGKQTLHQHWCGATVNSSNHILLRLLLEELVRWYRWPRLPSTSVPAPFSLRLSRHVTSMTSAIENHIVRPIAPHFF